MIDFLPLTEKLHQERPTPPAGDLCNQFPNKTGQAIPLRMPGEERVKDGLAKGYEIMGQGTVVSINITSKKHENLQTVDRIEAKAGCGLVGDRFFFQDGVSKGSRRGYQVTLIELEAIEAANQDYEIPLEPHETRRNIVTQGVALNHLVGKTFTVGSVQLKGVSLCEPCSHLQALTRPGVMKSLVHRGGLRAEILKDGIICVGDAVQD